MTSDRVTSSDKVTVSDRVTKSDRVFESEPTLTVTLYMSQDQQNSTISVNISVPHSRKKMPTTLAHRHNRRAAREENDCDCVIQSGFRLE